MSNQITKGILEGVVEVLNKQTGNPTNPWQTNENGRTNANIGNYHLSGAYGGWALHQMVNENGGVRDVFNCGYMPKKELYYMIRAMNIGRQMK